MSGFAAGSKATCSQTRHVNLQPVPCPANCTPQQGGRFTLPVRVYVQRHPKHSPQLSSNTRIVCCSFPATGGSDGPPRPPSSRHGPHHPNPGEEPPHNGGHNTGHPGLASQLAWLQESLLYAAAFTTVGFLLGVPTAKAAQEQHQQQASGRSDTTDATASGKAVTSAQPSSQSSLPQSWWDMPVPTGGMVPAIRRLLREVFADLITIKQQIQDLTPKSEDDDYVIPYEGGSVGPVLRRVVPGMHVKSKAQVTGDVTWALPALTTNTDGGHVNTGLTTSTAPEVTLLVQSMWSDKRHSLTARLSTFDHNVVATSLGMGAVLPAATPRHSPPSTHVATVGQLTSDSISTTSTSTISGSSVTRGSQLALQSMLYRAELLQGQVKVCIAPLKGSLSSIARRMNPLAASGSLTHIGSVGHGVPMVFESGRGAAATWILPVRDQHSSGGGSSMSGTAQEGALSVSLGHFVAPAGSSEASEHVRHTVGQLSLHTLHQGCISLVASSSTSHDASISAPPLTSSANQHGGIVDAPRMRQASNKLSRVGMCACTTLADAFTVAAWHARALQPSGGGQQGLVGSSQAQEAGALRPGLHVGGSSTGVQLCSLPDSKGVSLALTWAAVGGAGEGSPAGGALSTGVGSGIGHRAIGWLGSVSDAIVSYRTSHIGELSAYVPLRDGVSLTPGVVVGWGPVGRANNSQAGGVGSELTWTLACGTTWKF